MMSCQISQMFIAIIATYWMITCGLCASTLFQKNPVYGYPLKAAVSAAVSRGHEGSLDDDLSSLININNHQYKALTTAAVAKINMRYDEDHHGPIVRMFNALCRLMQEFNGHPYHNNAFRTLPGAETQATWRAQLDDLVSNLDLYKYLSPGNNVYLTKPRIATILLSRQLYIKLRTLMLFPSCAGKIEEIMNTDRNFVDSQKFADGSYIEIETRIVRAIEATCKPVERPVIKEFA